LGNKIVLIDVYCAEYHKVRGTEVQGEKIMFNHKYIILWLLIMGMFVLAACGDATSEAISGQEGEQNPGLANPASVYCEQLGYKLELRTTGEGSQGVCVFPDESECEEWDFLSGRCGQVFSHCHKKGYKLISEEGSNIGTCVFPDGSSCMELDYFEGRCEPGG
jgi:putative hemolysin